MAHSFPASALGHDKLIGSQLGCFSVELLLRILKWDHRKLRIQFSKVLFTFKAQLNYYEGSWFAADLKLIEKFSDILLSEETFKHSCSLEFRGIIWAKGIWIRIDIRFMY